MVELSKEEISKYEHHLDMGALRRFVEANKDVPDDVKVLCERVEDSYFEGSKTSGWGVYLNKGLFYYQCARWNNEMEEEVQRIEKGEEREYPELDNPHLRISSEEDLKIQMEQFHPSWCISINNEKDLIFIYNHY